MKQIVRSKEYKEKREEKHHFESKSIGNSRDDVKRALKFKLNGSNIRPNHTNQQPTESTTYTAPQQQSQSTFEIPLTIFNIVSQTKRSFCYCFFLLQFPIVY